MEPLVAGMMASELRERRSKIPYTVLHRPGGTWSELEVGLLVENLRTEVYQQRQHPEYLILYGTWSKDQTLEAIMGGIAYTAKSLIGWENPQLPFHPPLA